MAAQILELIPLDENSYNSRMSALKDRYVQDRMDSNMMNRDAATSFTSKQWESILADGKATRDHYFSHFRNKDKSNVRCSWIYVDKALQNAFVIEFYLDSKFRGQGLANPLWLP